MSVSKYNVYVIELRKKIFNENRKFREANPQFTGTLECLYVGSTAKSPQERFAQHINGGMSKKGINLSSSLVKKYGLYLRPSLYHHLNPITTRQEAFDMEQKLALFLRKKGYAVWFA